MHAAIASTRNTNTRSQISPMPSIMLVGIVDMPIITSRVPSRTRANRRVTPSWGGGFTAQIAAAEKWLMPPHYIRATISSLSYKSGVGRA